MDLTSFNAPIDAASFGVVQHSAPVEAPQRFSYDATEPKGRRKSPAVSSNSEDLLLDNGRRSKLSANSRDLQRNFAIAGWMIRRHLDYVATFQFHSRTGNDELDVSIERLIEGWSRPYNCDIAGRHCLRSMIRMTEARAVVDGDVGLLKLGTGHLQAIESDRIRNPSGITLDGQWLHGVKLDPAGRSLAYAISNRNGYGGFTHDRYVSAANLCLHGYFDRFDQVRGISPLASALNSLRDVYENFDYALAKAKVSQLFAFMITRNAAESAGVIGEGQSLDGCDGPREKKEYEVNFGRGPVLLDMDPGDSAEMLESDTPSTQFQDFGQMMIAVSLKALDIPYSFYDESHTNFFGSRGAWLHYQRSCLDKQLNLTELLRRLTIWRLMLFVLDGELVLPKGMNIGDLGFEWVPVGMPWWDPAKEIRGDVMAVAAGFDNPQRITKERGRGDWKDNIDKTADAMAYAREKGVPVSFVLGFEPEEPDDPTKDEPAKKPKPPKSKPAKSKPTKKAE